MDFDWVFLLLITGQVPTNLSQCQMVGHIHVPNSVCAIESTPRGSQSYHLGTGVQLSHVFPSIFCPLSIPVHFQDKKIGEILRPHHSTQHMWECLNICMLVYKSIHVSHLVNCFPFCITLQPWPCQVPSKARLSTHVHLKHATNPNPDPQVFTLDVPKFTTPRSYTWPWPQVNPCTLWQVRQHPTLIGKITRTLPESSVFSVGKLVQSIVHRVSQNLEIISKNFQFSTRPPRILMGFTISYLVLIVNPWTEFWFVEKVAEIMSSLSTTIFSVGCTRWGLFWKTGGPLYLGNSTKTFQGQDVPSALGPFPCLKITSTFSYTYLWVCVLLYNDRTIFNIIRIFLLESHKPLNWRERTYYNPHLIFSLFEPPPPPPILDASSWRGELASWGGN